jgi:hypothetical protein
MNVPCLDSGGLLKESFRDEREWLVPEPIERRGESLAGAA